VRAPLPASAWLLNAVAIAIAVVLAPALTSSSATTAVPARPAVVAAAASPATPQPMSSQGQEVPDLTTQSEADDFDDTLAAPPPGKAVKSNGSDFVSPVPGAITGGFGMRFHPILHYWRMHDGVDMHAACGTAVVAAYRGTVIQAGPNGGYGNLVVIDHGMYQGKHVISKYAHLSRIGVVVGQKVDTGEGIALSGTTGLSTGCHLHFEIKENGVYVDPAPYLTGKPSPRPDGPIKNLGPTTSPSPTPSATPSVTRTATPNVTRTAKPTPKPSKTKTATPAPSPTPTPDPSESTTPTPTPTPTPSETPSKKADPDPTESATKSAEPEPTRTEARRSESDDPSPSTTATP
jgi:murein DD-endopeptidase MepM/ murein hydrolase activator NlpD